ncbi:hypothetical protein CCR94_01055 [Rhodoblastus sphagnicola]|uniref:Immunity protein 35 domain-containing protein n=1 Tax=Rhodoblastus sphagnicola TaxID=333368 RepID=A0A2S6NGD6_9HYPH|nr:hypothetical protein CCR94_01055 [Rhodoblastus sphagnicola]
MLFVSFLTAEELRYGRLLGLARFPCELVGGKHAFAQYRCVLRTCTWFKDCGYWVAPGNWRDRVAPGDTIATTVFWLGEPSGIAGDRYFWPYYKGGSRRRFAATFHDGRFVEWRDEAQDLLPMKKITIDEARSEAMIFLSKVERDTDFIVIPGKEREYPFGWVFFGASRKYWKTGELKYEVPGLGPLVVEFDGSVHPLTTSGTPDAVIADYLHSWQARQERRNAP